nr:PREDICTED: zinc finger BED domain-containing protein 5-like [Latimeria chalumnae]|eukprot:XP_014354333.1 PREDICTED: zinc finger BED domain-containing protein 5-like [Latimeria chalumnae]
MGFTCTRSADDQRPQCVLCYEVLSNESLKPANLRRHLETKHPQFKDKSTDFFERKLNELTTGKKIVHSASSVNMKALEASFCVSQRIAKAGKPHTIAENLLLPAAKDMVTAMVSEKAAKQLDLIPLSDNTVARQIHEMAEDIKNQLIAQIKSSSYFALQLDESTDVASIANLLVYVKYEFEYELLEDFLFCRPLPTRTCAEDLFNLLDAFLKENGMDWAKCIGICTDSAHSMTGSVSGLVVRIRKVAPDVHWEHCTIHREALAAKKMPGNLKSVLDMAVKMVNFIKARSLNSRIFSTLCNEMGNEHGKNVTIFNVRDKIEAFIKKLRLWVSRVRENNFDTFETLDSFLAENELTLDSDVKSEIEEYLVALKSRFRHYFPEMFNENEWIRNPFVADCNSRSCLTAKEEEQLLELSCDGGLKLEFKQEPLARFWLKIKEEYPDLTDKAIKVLMPFTTTYLCESGFSALVSMKTKYRNKLDVEGDLRLKLSPILPNLHVLCAKKQAQPSH